MTKVTIPDPVCEVENSLILDAEGFADTRIPVINFQKHNLPVGTTLITTAQAEAYANSILAPTSQALEVAQVALERICAIDRVGECESIAMEALSDIRALIQKDET